MRRRTCNEYALVKRIKKRKLGSDDRRQERERDDDDDSDGDRGKGLA